MKRITGAIMLCLAGALTWSCSGTIDPEGEDTQLILSADHTEIVADGRSEVTFTVTYGVQDVSSTAMISCISGQADIKGNKFTTTEEGTYRFTATYNGKTSNETIVTALAPLESRFERNVCVMEFTGTWCSQCPSGAVALNFMVEESYKGKAYALAFHNDDIYAIPQEQDLYKKFKVGGYPGYVTDMRDVGLLTTGGCSTSIERSLYETETHCGAALRCEASENADGSMKVSATAKVFSEKEMKYMLAAYIIEDKIKGEQNLGDKIDKDYTHRHVVRKMLSSTIMGDDLGVIKTEKEAEKKYEFTIDSQWNAENLSLAVLVIDENGQVNNMAICKCLNGEMAYEMKNKE